MERSQARAGLVPRVHAARHRPLPGRDLRGHRARHAPVRRVRRGAGQDKVAYNQVKKARRRHQRLRDERGALAPDPHAAREPRDHGLPRRGADAEGRRDAGDGGQPAARASAASTRVPRSRGSSTGASAGCSTSPATPSSSSTTGCSGRGITLWGAAVDTLENTSRFAEGKTTGPMAVFHLFDSPLVLSRPYESYMGCLTVPRRVAAAGRGASRSCSTYRTPRAQVMEVDRGHLPRRPAASTSTSGRCRGRAA